MIDRVERALIGSLPPDADGRLHRLYAYWNAIRPAPDVLPGRQHFDPAIYRLSCPISGCSTSTAIRCAFVTASPAPSS